MDEPAPSETGSSWLTWRLTSWSAPTPRQAQRAGAPGGRAPLPVPARRGQRADQRGGQPGAKVAKPRRLPSTWQAVRDAQLGEINEAAAAGAMIPGWIRCCCTPRSPAAAAASDHLVRAVRVALGSRCATDEADRVVRLKGRDAVRDAPVRGACDPAFATADAEGHCLGGCRRPRSARQWQSCRRMLASIQNGGSRASCSS